MKAKLFFMSLLATVFFFSCSSDESLIISPEGGDAIGEPQFLSVNLVTSGESTIGTRVVGAPTKDDNGNNVVSNYEIGLEDENELTNVRFYFFAANGDAQSVKKTGDTWVNYLDYTPTSTEESNTPNVEEIFGATLILQSPNGDKFPEGMTMVAIVNPTTELSGEISLTNLKKKYGNYAANNTTKGTFVMSNSTYGSGNPLTEMMEVEVGSNIKNSKGEALDNPVELYVERTVAKVRLGLSNAFTEAEKLANGTLLYDPSDPSKKDEDGNVVEQKFGETKIYVKFFGWNATAVADNSRLVKKINTNWSGTLLGTFGPWNWSDYRRSFWAVNVNNTDNNKALGYQYGAFKNTNDNTNLFQAQEKTKFDKTQWVYLNENAADYPNDTSLVPTKVIIAAQLVDENGAAIEFAEYGSSRCSVSDLTQLFADGSGIYKRTVVEGNKHYEKIGSSDLTIKTATELGIANASTPGRYKVYVQLSDAVADGVEKGTIVLCSSNVNTTDNSNVLTKSRANNILKALGYAKVWKNGYTYYYFNIEHGTNGEKKRNGVVRNHIYDADITSLVGLGTPVYKPEEIIYPEIPTPETDTYLAARINILSWRVVKNDISLVWP